MQHRILSAIIAAAFSIAAIAQETCTIKGHIADTQLGDGAKVKKVTLTRTNELGQTIEVATAKVKKGSYTFTYKMTEGEPTLQYAITGFGEGSIALFVEPGEVNIATAQATQPEQSQVSGTPTNDTYAEYQGIYTHAQAVVAEQVAALEAAHGAAWLETAEGKSAIKRIEAKEAIHTKAQVLRFLIDHNASPMTPLVVERTQLPQLSDAYAEQITKAMSTTLHAHPYYLSLRNSMLAGALKVGNEAPNITLPLLTGETTHLTDYLGKYVILNFWAPGCDKSAAMLAEMKKVYEEVVKANADQFVIISIALDSNLDAWREAVSSNEINREGWLHACDGVGASSPAARLLKVEAAPKILLIEPEGRAVSLNMENDEIIMRLEQILMGDLYYLDQKE